MYSNEFASQNPLTITNDSIDNKTNIKLLRTFCNKILLMKLNKIQFMTCQKKTLELFP